MINQSSVLILLFELSTFLRPPPLPTYTASGEALARRKGGGQLATLTLIG